MWPKFQTLSTPPLASSSLWNRRLQGPAELGSAFSLSFSWGISFTRPSFRRPQYHKFQTLSTPPATSTLCSRSGTRSQRGIPIRAMRFAVTCQSRTCTQRHVPASGDIVTEVSQSTVRTYRFDSNEHTCIILEGGYVGGWVNHLGGLVGGGGGGA